MRYEVMSQAEEAASAPRSRAMSGRATTIIVELSGTRRFPRAIATTNAGTLAVEEVLHDVAFALELGDRRSDLSLRERLERESLNDLVAAVTL